MEGHSFKPNVLNFVNLMQECQFLDDVPDAKHFSNDNSSTVNNPWLPSTSSTCADMLGDYGSCGLLRKVSPSQFFSKNTTRFQQSTSGSLEDHAGAGPVATNVSLEDINFKPRSAVYFADLGARAPICDLGPNAKNFSNDNSGTVHNPWIPETSSTRADAWGLRCLLDLIYSGKFCSSQQLLSRTRKDSSDLPPHHKKFT